MLCFDFYCYSCIRWRFGVLGDTDDVSLDNVSYRLQILCLDASSCEEFAAFIVLDKWCAPNASSKLGRYYTFRADNGFSRKMHYQHSMQGILALAWCFFPPCWQTRNRWAKPAIRMTHASIGRQFGKLTWKCVWRYVLWFIAYIRLTTQRGQQSAVCVSFATLSHTVCVD